jgi:hypothetical protein
MLSDLQVMSVFYIDSPPPLSERGEDEGEGVFSSGVNTKCDPRPWEGRGRYPVIRVFDFSQDR